MLVKHGQITGIVLVDKTPTDAEVLHLSSGYLAPGFVDLQVNGGGGVLLNNAPNLNGTQPEWCSNYMRSPHQVGHNVAPAYPDH